MFTHLLDRKTLGVRVVAAITLVTMIVGPTAPAFAALATLTKPAPAYSPMIRGGDFEFYPSSSTPRQQTLARGNPVGGDPSGEIPWSRAERLLPATLTLADDAAGSTELWRLFDNRADLGVVGSNKPLRFRVELQRMTEFEALGVYGSSDGTLTIAPDSDPSARESFSFGANKEHSLKWSRHEWAKPIRTKVLWVTWQPAKSDASLRELELWGRPLGSQREAEITREEFPDAIYTGLPKGATAFWSNTEEQTISVASISTTNHTGVFNVELTSDPRSFERAFLVYELSGRSHFTSVKRAINQQSAVGGNEAGSNSEKGLQVEEISPAWLRKGQNSISFFPTESHNPIGYHVRALRIVGVPIGIDASDGESARAWHALRDENGGTGWTLSRVGKAEQRIWSFAAPTQPRTLEFKLEHQTSGTLVLRTLGEGAHNQVVTKLNGLSNGWHRIPLDSLPTSQSVSVSLMSDSLHPEQTATLAELSVSGSPVPVDQSPQVAVTSPFKVLFDVGPSDLYRTVYDLS